MKKRKFKLLLMGSSAAVLMGLGISSNVQGRVIKGYGYTASAFSRAVTSPTATKYTSSQGINNNNYTQGQQPMTSTIVDPFGSDITYPVTVNSGSRVRLPFQSANYIGVNGRLAMAPAWNVWGGTYTEGTWSPDEY